MENKTIMIKIKNRPCPESRKNNFENQISQTAEHVGC